MWFLTLSLMACELDEPGVEELDSTECPDRDAGEGISPLDLEGDAACGADLFVETCASCHGQDGLGADAGPALDEHVPFHTDEQLVYVLIAGGDEMPPPGIGPQQMADVVKHMRAEFGEYSGTGH